jgi:hypothetical protein
MIFEVFVVVGLRTVFFWDANILQCLTLWRQNFLLNFSTPCIYNVNNTRTKKGSVMK